MPAPILPEGNDALQMWVADVEDRLSALETPQGFLLAYLTVSTNLTTANASDGLWCVVSDLKTIAYAKSGHWLRVDTGAQIV